MDDKQIIALFLARSEDAIEEAAKKYGAYCRSIAFHILQNEADTEEALEETLIGAEKTDDYSIFRQ